MIGEISTLVVGVFKCEVFTTLVGFLPDVIDRIDKARYRFVKHRRIDALVRYC